MKKGREEGRGRIRKRREGNEKKTRGREGEEEGK